MVETLSLPDFNLDAVTILSDDDNTIDAEIQWTEEKVILEAVDSTNPNGIRYSVKRSGYISLRDKGKFWYIANLGKKASILSRASFKEYGVQPLAIDLIKSLRDLNVLSLKEVRISELSIDKIPSLKAEIASCSIKALKSLIRGTKAKVKSLAIDLPNGDRLSISVRGGSKYYSESAINWPEVVDEVHECHNQFALID